MTETISPETFDHLVELAALEMKPGEAEYLRRELNNQLKALRELQSIPVGADVPFSRHGVPFPPEISSEPRPDEWQAYTDVDALLGQVPQLDERYIIVPDIPHTKLE